MTCIIDQNYIGNHTPNCAHDGSSSTISDLLFSIGSFLRLDSYDQCNVLQKDLNMGNLSNLELANLDIIDWTDRTKNFNDRIFFVVLHHTVTNNAEQTINAFNSAGVSSHYIVDEDGLIYRVVEDEKRAWHAGLGAFDQRSNLNDTSIGIEIVNMGDQEFPDVQIFKVAELTKFLMGEYSIKSNHVISHADLAPDRKYDPSGYFNWEKFYDQIGIFDGLYKSDLTPEEKHEVLLENGSPLADRISKLQKDLKAYGYEIQENGVYDEKTCNVVQAFNRHFSPEVFIKEVVEDGKVIVNSENQRWYKISEERLAFLLDHLNKQEE